MIRASILVAVLALAGCGGDNGTGGGGGPHDMAVSSVLTRCGQVGDVGNSLGIGKFCTTVKDCPDTAPLCSAIGNNMSMPSADDTYFCTILGCTPDGGTNECAENASCVCGSGGGGSGCVCTPTSCQH